MATLCSHCGEELPRDDARFCAKCGVEWPARSSNPPSFAGANSNLSSGVTPPEDVQAATQNGRERVSPQLPLQRQQHSDAEQPPAWMQGLQRERRNEPASKDKGQQIRALRVKVWDGVDSSRSRPELKEDGMQTEDAARVRIENKQSMDVGMQEDQSVEDLPTRSMESIPQAPQVAIDDIPTNPVLALPNEQLQAAPEQHTYVVQEQQPPEQVPASVADVSHVSTAYLQVQQQGQVVSPSSVSPRDNYTVGPRSSPALPARARKRLPLIVGLSAVLLLLVLALSSWIILLQPFRVSPATDTQQSFTDAKLGVSLRYPSGWKKPQVDYHKQMILLEDGSDTAQVNISIANASTESPESYLQKQVAQLRVSNAKAGTSSSFGGISWQTTQGDAQVKGAEYTCGVFTTLHNNHFYTLSQLAPRSIYTDEEKLVFAPTRLSLHFL